MNENNITHELLENQNDDQSITMIVKNDRKTTHLIKSLPFLLFNPCNNDQRRWNLRIFSEEDNGCGFSGKNTWRTKVKQK